MTRLTRTLVTLFTVTVLVAGGAFAAQAATFPSKPTLGTTHSAGASATVHKATFWKWRRNRHYWGGHRHSWKDDHYRKRHWHKRRHWGKRHHWRDRRHRRWERWSRRWDRRW